MDSSIKQCGVTPPRNLSFRSLITSKHAYVSNHVLNFSLSWWEEREEGGKKSSGKHFCCIFFPTILQGFFFLVVAFLASRTKTEIYVHFVKYFTGSSPGFLTKATLFSPKVAFQFQQLQSCGMKRLDSWVWICECICALLTRMFSSSVFAAGGRLWSWEGWWGERDREREREREFLLVLQITGWHHLHLSLRGSSGAQRTRAHSEKARLGNGERRSKMRANNFHVN